MTYAILDFRLATRLRRIAGSGCKAALGVLVSLGLSSSLLAEQPVAVRVATPDSNRAAPSAAKPVVVDLVQRKVVKDEQGNEKLVDAANVLPGDVIEYRATYRNVGQTPVNGLVATLPIPEGLEYLAKSANPRGGVRAAANDNVFAPEPLLRKAPSGKSESVPYNEYRALRWDIGRLAAGNAVVVGARVRVESVVPKLPPKLVEAAPQAPPKSVQK